jgi:hypothetical protein
LDPSSRSAKSDGRNQLRLLAKYHDIGTARPRMGRMEPFANGGKCCAFACCHDRWLKVTRSPARHETTRVMGKSETETAKEHDKQDEYSSKQVGRECRARQANVILHTSTYRHNYRRTKSRKTPPPRSNLSTYLFDPEFLRT